MVKDWSGDWEYERHKSIAFDGMVNHEPIKCYAFAIKWLYWNTSEVSEKLYQSTCDTKEELSRAIKTLECVLKYA